MTCPSCKNEVKGNWCPTCKKTISTGGFAGGAGSTSGSIFNKSDAMNQRGSANVKDKTIDGLNSSNARQQKYSSHLQAKDKASDFGNSTRNKRWNFLEKVSLAVLFGTSVIALLAFFLPFFQGTIFQGENTFEGGISGLKIMGFDWSTMGTAKPIIGTMILLSFVLTILMLLFSLAKLVSSVLPQLNFVNNKVATYILGMLSLLMTLFMVLSFFMVTSLIKNKETDQLYITSTEPGIGILLLLLTGIFVTLLSILIMITRMKINTLNLSGNRMKSRPNIGLGDAKPM
ncbi:MAG: hypothetical protein LBU60_05840 [Clostridiales bacterium]|jgi:hypothetical protein|nr:hypothetical protein [Clostridiales bacterium]